MAENVGSSDIWSDGVEKSENCRTQTLPLTLLLRRLPPRAKRHLPPRRRPPKRLLLLQRNPRQRKRLPQRRLLLARLRRLLLLKRNSLFLQMWNHPHRYSLPSSPYAKANEKVISTPLSSSLFCASGTGERDYPLQQRRRSRGLHRRQRLRPPHLYVGRYASGLSCPER